LVVNDDDQEEDNSFKNKLRYWIYTAKLGIVRIDSKQEKYDLETKEQRNQDVNTIDYESRIKSGYYDSGAAARMGWTIGGKYYAIGVDLDGWHAVKAWFGGLTDEETWDNVLQFARENRVEWHQDKTRLHLIYLLYKDCIIKKAFTHKSFCARRW
jgi:hypothetical protein